MLLEAQNIVIPADVPENMKETYSLHYSKATHNSGNLMLFAGDQKVEHLNDDFYGEGISSDDNSPEHLFNIASKARIGVFAAQMGLIARYGMDYPEVPYLIKLNSKSHLVKTSQKDPSSSSWFTFKHIMEFVETSKLNIVGVGYTIYLGSEYESDMLREAAQMVFKAHQHGLLTVLWIYPRGAAVPDEKNPHLIAGATGVAAALGTDFVKVNYPKVEGQKSEEIFKEAIKAAGRTKVICAGGSTMDVPKFLQTLYNQIHVAGASGNATGRNIHQKSLDEAVRFANAISAITIDGSSVDEALKIYNG